MHHSVGGAHGRPHLDHLLLPRRSPRGGVEHDGFRLAAGLLHLLRNLGEHSLEVLLLAVQSHLEHLASRPRLVDQLQHFGFVELLREKASFPAVAESAMLLVASTHGAQALGQIGELGLTTVRLLRLEDDSRNSAPTASNDVGRMLVMRVLMGAVFRRAEVHTSSSAAAVTAAVTAAVGGRLARIPRPARRGPAGAVVAEVLGPTGRRSETSDVSAAGSHSRLLSLPLLLHLARHAERVLHGGPHDGGPAARGSDSCTTHDPHPEARGQLHAKDLDIFPFVLKERGLRHHAVHVRLGLLHLVPPVPGGCVQAVDLAQIVHLFLQGLGALQLVLDFGTIGRRLRLGLLDLRRHGNQDLNEGAAVLRLEGGVVRRGAGLRHERRRVAFRQIASIMHSIPEAERLEQPLEVGPQRPVLWVNGHLAAGGLPVCRLLLAPDVDQQGREVAE
mmetsp:Transcript_76012/g.232637  ORF Transcript_76012/g.232637 Transcript_76012/m.232637 type:complete len:446 (-) Transcript_76012:201-1538(-)